MRLAVIRWGLGLAATLSGWGLAQGALRFREPVEEVYQLEELPAARAAPAPAWLAARPLGSTNILWLGDQVVLQVVHSNALPGFLAGRPLTLVEALDSNVFVLQAPDARQAARAAAQLAEESGVLVSHPVRRRPVRLHGGFASRPNDPLFPRQWHLENRDTNTAERLGYDLNARAAWAVTRGEGVVVAQGDDGMETDHPDLMANATGPHFNFFTGLANGSHPSSAVAHGTAVAGLIAAEAGYRRGVVGVAPAARLASWVVFDAGGNYLSETQSRNMFQYASNVVAVQNHSWGNANREPLSLGVLESQGIANAVNRGRNGLGVVIVRAAGNERLQLNNANDDGYANDPRAITVGAVRANGEVTSYSTPGACVLVAAFSADKRVQLGTGVFTNHPTLTTTDRRGSLGYHVNTFGGLADYAFDTTGFEGTSGSTPQIAGLCALILSARPDLTWRDVQQLLLLAARHLHPADPDLRTNGAGLRVSHHVGFGVPDAGRAVELARAWPRRPPRFETTVSTSEARLIPDDGLRVRITGPRVPAELESIPVWPTDGPHADDPTEPAPLVDVGLALEPIAADLRGKAALIERGQNDFVQKIRHAAAAGARVAIIWNNVGTTDRVFIQGAESHFLPIPTVFMDRNRGQALRDWLAGAGGAARAQLALEAVRYTLPVSVSLQCEHVLLRVRTTHSRRGDLRITLVSPAGTRSVLHHFNEDLSRPLRDWTFSSVHHFFEPSAGEWRVEISDQRPGVVGQVTALDLTLTGVAIMDEDRDGLDDAWERRHFGDLRAGPRDDPDRDGLNHLVESLLGTDPRQSAPVLSVELTRWDSRFWRLAWPATPYARYRLETAPRPEGPYAALTELSTDFARAEWLLPVGSASSGFYRVLALEPR